jgi:hypothetical protein
MARQGSGVMATTFVIDVKSECSCEQVVSLTVGANATHEVAPLTTPDNKVIAADRVRVRIADGKVKLTLVGLTGVEEGRYEGSVKLTDSLTATQTVALVAECRSVLWWS